MSKSIVIVLIAAFPFWNNALGQDEIERERIISLVELASQQIQLAAYDSSESNLLQALDLAEQNGGLGLKAKVRSQLGILNVYRGNYASALENIQLSLSAYEATKDSVGIADCLNTMGSIYYSQKQFLKAKQSYEKSLRMREQLDDKRQLAISLNNMGSAYSKLGQPKEAEVFHKRSLVLWDKMGSVSGKAITLELIGGCLKEQGKLDSALIMLNEGYNLLQTVEGEIRSLVLFATKIGELLTEMGRASEALIWCRKAQEDAIANDFKQDLQNSCKCLYKANLVLGRSMEALESYQCFIRMRDSIFGQEMTQRVTQLEMNYAFEKEQLADSLRFVAESQLQESRIQRQRIGLVSIGGMLVLASALALVVYQGKQKSEMLLLNILPKATAEELKAKGRADTKSYNSVSVLFTDFKGFTDASEKLTPQELVAEINTCFEAFDGIVDKYRIEKIKTIGDAYMAAGGVPIPYDDSVKNTTLAALEMQEFVSKRKAQLDMEGKPGFEMRVGVHTGPVVAGIVGVKKFQYDIWGDTVNTASRMESSGEVGKVNVSESTYELLKNDSQFSFESRGKVKAKGKGEMQMYFVVKKA